MDEPFLLVDNSAIAPALLLQVIHDLGLKLCTVRVPLHCTDNLDSKDFLLCLILLVIHQGTLERSSECAVTQMSNYLVFGCILLLTCQNHTILPDKVICIFTPVDLLTLPGSSVSSLIWAVSRLCNRAEPLRTVQAAA